MVLMNTFSSFLLITLKDVDEAWVLHTNNTLWFYSSSEELEILL